MEKQFINYDLALKLKELGFDEECFAYYNNNHLGVYQNEDYYLSSDSPPDNRIEAPLWQQAFDWIRINKNIQIHIFIFDNEWYFNGRNIKSDSGYFDESNNKYPTYEDARLACLEKLIELVENKKG